MTINLFDSNFYRAANPDLASVGSRQLNNHLLTFGLNEGRQFSPFVDLNFYRASNPDLAGLNNRQLFDHLQSFGIAEGRRFSQVVDLDFYRAVNRDLAGLNNEQLLDHLRTAGLNEGRRFSPYVDLNYYRASNSDLVPLSNTQLLQHLQIFGLNEDRQFSQFFNPDFYELNNPDLPVAGLSSDRQLLTHFVFYGISEGRSASFAFDLSYYQATNIDLNQLSNLQVYQHYQIFGLNEGRVSSQNFDVQYYLQSNPDLQNVGFNNAQAFTHFLLFGLNEGRGSVPFGSRITGWEVSFELDVRDGTQSVLESLDRNDRPNPTRLGSYSDDYRLVGLNPGQQATIDLVAINNSFDTYVQLINASTGQVIAFDDDSGEGLNSRLTFTATAGVEYAVRVTSFNINAIGDYRLSVTPASTIAGSLSGSGSLSGRLSSTDFVNPTRFNTFRDDYRLTGVTAGQQIRINLTGDFDSYLQLVNAATGEVLSFNDDANGTLNSELAFTVQDGNNYLVRVTSYDAQETGSYTLATTTLATAAIALDQTVVGTLSNRDPDNPLRPGAFRDDYQLTGATAGQQIRINLSSEVFDTYLSVLVNGVEIANDDDSGDGLNSELVLTVQANTTYTIRATSYADFATGTYRLTTTPLTATDWIGANITDAGLQAIVRSRSADGTLDRNDMLAIFRAPGLTDGGVIDATEVANLRTLVNNGSRFRMADYVQFLSQRVADGTSVNLSVNTFDGNFVQRWFLGTGPLGTPTARFDETDDNDRVVARTTLAFTPAQGRLFSATGRARIEDIDQGSFGDCAFLAALAATFERNDDASIAAGLNNSGTARSRIIDSMIIDNGDNTYTVRFYSNSTPQWVTVDQRVVTQNGRIYGASANGSSDPSNPNNVLWVPLVERAYAQWREWREGAPGYNLIGNGDTLANPLRYVTGRGATDYTARNDRATFDIINTALQQGRAVSAGGAQSNSPFFISGHAYSVNNAYIASNGELRIVVRNPWGVDVGRQNRQSVGNANDGFLDVSLADFVGGSSGTRGFRYFTVS